MAWSSLPEWWPFVDSLGGICVLILQCWFTLGVASIPQPMLFSSFFKKDTFRNVNFLDLPSIERMYASWSVAQDFVSLTSDLTAPYVRDLDAVAEQHESYGLCNDLLLGIRTSTYIHSEYTLSTKSMMISKALQRCCCRERPKVVREDITYHYSPRDGGNHIMDCVALQIKKPSKLEFIEYFPTEFARLRAWSGITCDLYIETFEDSLLSFVSNSKSGMFFFYSSNGKFLVKSLKEDEFVFLKSIFVEYFVYLGQHTNSLINKFFGCYGVRHKSKMVHFVVMESIFYSDLSVDTIYDLKGSTKGRSATKKDLKRKVPVLKDMDWKQGDRRIDIGSVRAQLYKEQLLMDTEFLRSLNIMDYSLLVGVHEIDREDGEGVRYGRAPTVDHIECPHLFTNCHRGMMSTNGDEVYFGGIIDILQRFTTKKKAENLLKRIKAKQNEISCVAPEIYAERMVTFLRDYIR